MIKITFDIQARTPPLLAFPLPARSVLVRMAGKDAGQMEIGAFQLFIRRVAALDPLTRSASPPGAQVEAAVWPQSQPVMLYPLSPVNLARWLPGCGSCRHSLLHCFLNDCSRGKSSHQSIDDMPEHLRFNPWILSGYRAPQQSTAQCIKSIGQVHNETVNILTHGFPILYVLLNSRQILAPPHSLPCFLTYCHLVSCLSPWLGSFLYHVFMNHKAGPALYLRLLQADMAGIWITQTFGALTTLNASFMALGEPSRRAFLGLYLCLAMWALRKGFIARSASQRALSFAPLVAMRSVALVARLSTSLLVANSWHLTHLLNQELLPILGAFLSATRVPERFCPGVFDLFLNSHNLMHCLVLFSSVSLSTANPFFTLQVVLGGIHMHHSFLYDIAIVRAGQL